MDLYVVSLRGLREQNEDKHVVDINSSGKDNTKHNINLYSVFDGHGGKFVSSFLSKTLPQLMMSKSLPYPLKKDNIDKLFSYLQNAMKSKYYNDVSHCGSTSLIVAQFKRENSNYLNVLNLGDSRCVMCRDNIAVALTKDHKPYWPEERRRIEKLGGKVLMDRDGEWRIRDLSVSRAFGDLDSEKYVSHIPELFEYKLQSTDKFIVLGCDGLWDVMENQEVINFILDTCYDETLINRKNKNINIARLLAEHAIKKGSTDNVTVIVVFFK